MRKHEREAALRAAVVTRLIGVHGFTQLRAAASLGVSQGAVSQYMKGIRGAKERNGSVDALCDEIAVGNLSAGEARERLRRLL